VGVVALPVIFDSRPEGAPQAGAANHLLDFTCLFDYAFMTVSRKNHNILILRIYKSFFDYSTLLVDMS
jgi:hypothetical protein